MQKLIPSKLQHDELIHIGRLLPFFPRKRIKHSPLWSPVLPTNLSWLGDSWWCLLPNVMKGREEK